VEKTCPIKQRSNRYPKQKNLSVKKSIVICIMGQELELKTSISKNRLDKPEEEKAVSSI
jgi:hypothetical protein